MKKTVALLLGLTFATAAYAQCRTHSITTPDGRFIMCTTCCFGPGNCTTTCI